MCRDPRQGTTATAARSAAERARDIPRERGRRVVVSCNVPGVAWGCADSLRRARTSSGGYDTFIDPRGGGTVKVDSLGIIQPRGTFFEHVHLGLDTITYWGLSPVYNPDCTP